MNGTTNKVLLIGNLGDDVKLHHFDEQNCIGRFPIATTESYISRTGERITETEWHNIVTRNKLAELCDRYLKKGDKVFVEGRIKTRKWDDNGQMRYTTEIVANSIEFLTPKIDHEQRQAMQNEQNKVQKTQENTTIEPPFIDEGEDDLPF
ncbi:single-stranded DNA-binding protein [Empedobacter stercoris]|uniref:Single-stranded DNA-binding protein n=1 Tax=Empedobacter stercoris TaxID=1628248 RepID=A0ABX1WNC4_9FLAO|nr:single-stranded DNA-binding protein [Empedobacter stercoris]MCA4776738.1 single-stranded DNA-binding protein [Empedobacter stercoris]MCA4781100.1 single-stranded DNA-binding protein [Empedobacter stercoris]MCA4810066.1 single-stranded DNA-binding protein [Empedobacter stercoris]NOJ76189.1 single-stranded DNA-binding protein [Empedobacter stercoris]QNT15225.1 single-stranded DNA-binding protein [Empedobacter stercoris]